LTPLRGARITDFTAESGKRFDLEYQISGKTNHVRYALESDGGVQFEFVDAGGQVKTARYEASGSGRSGGRGGERRKGGEDGGPPRREPVGGRSGRDGGLRPPEGAKGSDAGATNRLPWLRAHLVEIDSDGDGELTRAELTAEVEKTVARLDADRNGAITVAEKQGQRGGGGTAMSGFVGQHWEEVDSDGDGRVTRAEVEAVAKRMFEKADSDRDGKLSRDEIAVMTSGRERGPGGGGRKP
jgi:Ca2+-binding EF-hand superfamily protein